MRVVTQQALSVRKLREQVGAEATGVDLTAPVDEPTRLRLCDAVARHGCLVIRDQRFDAHAFLAAGRLFGEPVSRRYANPLPGLPLVQRLSSHDREEDGSVLRTGQSWHTDQADEERPPKFTLLYAVELFREGGTTGIVNMRAAYEALPDALKARLDGLKVVYGAPGPAKGRHQEPEGPGGSADAPPHWVVHPLVRTIPETGQRALHLHPGRVRGVVGLPPALAKALLSDLVRRALRPEFIYNHAWTLGDLLLWDNRSTMHRANYDYDPMDTTQHRCMYRMMVEGERPR